MNKRKVLLIGLDSAPPELVFDKFRSKLPNLDEIIDKGIYGPLKSCHPPITIPAWMAMMTGKNPGKLGLYGFRHRKPNSYTDYYIANSYSIKEPTLWDYIADFNKRSCVVGVPPTYPPRPVNGSLISCFITPNAERDFTYPPRLKHTVENLVGKYMFDVVFRTDDRRKILEELNEMTDKRFKVIRYLIQNEKWDFFSFVEIGVDRVHHAFWKFFDTEHDKYVPGNEFEHVVEDYYRYIDEQIGELLKIAGKDTVVYILSDHGTKRMKGAFCINEWLANEGYLTLNRRPETVTDIENADIDWSHTKAWGWGGYYARIFLNLNGREPKGAIDPVDYESERDELALKLNAISDPHGRRMETKVYKPEELYPVLNGDPPDLIVYFDNLYWRSAGTIGYKTLYLSENDKGPDDSIHSMHGIYMTYNPEENYTSKRVDEVDILDVMPTILNAMDIPIPKDMEGKVLE